MAGNNGGGPWGGSDNSDDGQKTNEPVGSGGGGQKIPEIEDIVKKGQEQLRVLMGGKSGKTGGSGGQMEVGGSRKDLLV
jgi:membrane protease subunit HflK